MNFSRLAVVATCVAAGIAIVRGLMGGGAPIDTPASLLSSTVSAGSAVSVSMSARSDDPVPQSTLVSVSTVAPVVTPLPSLTPSPAVPRIGIVAGHWGSDSGAVCPDGLEEVQINLDIAQRVVGALEPYGYHVDLLKEFDPLLYNYRADALVSIHTDSCDPYPGADPPASGFKVTNVEDSAVPEVEQRLVECLSTAYQARTELFFHENTITYDMRRYHLFYEIDKDTPAAIIEIGFMYEDRQLLTGQPDQVAQGIVDGILCFMSERVSD
ncbi:MAG: hypothetical protein GX620_03600 [Chloroflexi bacterium]|nr:hypothetical protein [Chloroflexota bacterium]